MSRISGLYLLHVSVLCHSLTHPLTNILFTMEVFIPSILLYYKIPFLQTMAYQILHWWYKRRALCTSQYTPTFKLGECIKPLKEGLQPPDPHLVARNMCSNNRCSFKQEGHSSTLQALLFFESSKSWNKHARKPSLVDQAVL